LPDERHLQLIEMATHMAAVCIGKQQSEAEREAAVAREKQARLDRKTNASASRPNCTTAWDRTCC
jgi:hypothetical protein